MLKIVFNQIICALMVLNVGMAWTFCFDDAFGRIFVTLKDRTHLEKWYLEWSEYCTWSDVAATSTKASALVTASGCCSRGKFKLWKGKRSATFAFWFHKDVHVKCAPRHAYCTFLVSVVRRNETYHFDGGRITCGCVGDYVEVREVTWGDSKANVTYSAIIEHPIAFEYEHSFN